MKYSQMEDNLSWTCDFLQSQTSRKRGCVWKSQEELVPSLHALLAVRRPRVLSLCPGGPWEGGKRSHWDGQAKPGEAQENKEEEEKEVRFFPNRAEMMFVKVWQTAGLFLVCEHVSGILTSHSQHSPTLFFLLSLFLTLQLPSFCLSFTSPPHRHPHFFLFEDSGDMKRVTSTGMLKAPGLLQ